MDSIFKQYLDKPKLGSEKIALEYQQKIEHSMEEEFHSFKTENEKMKQNFTVSTRYLNVFHFFFCNILFNFKELLSVNNFGLNCFTNLIILSK